MATTARVLVAAALLAGVSYLVWYGLDQALGRSIPAQIVSLSAALGTGAAVYTGAVFAIGIEEAHQVRRLIAGRLRRG